MSHEQQRAYTDPSFKTFFLNRVTGETECDYPIINTLRGAWTLSWRTSYTDEITDILDQVRWNLTDESEKLPENTKLKTAFSKAIVYGKKSVMAQLKDLRELAKTEGYFPTAKKIDEQIKTLEKIKKIAIEKSIIPS